MMDRRTFLKGTGATLAGAGVMAAGAAPVLASCPPTRMIVGADLNIYEYPDRTTIIPLDGTGVIDFPSVRIEQKLTFQSGPGFTGEPPEHWTLRMEVWGFDSSRNQTVRLWDTLWHHANSDGAFGTVEVVQANSYAFQPGPGRIRTRVVGDMSGFDHTFDVGFTVVSS